jgi:hypothetical protein
MSGEGATRAECRPRGDRVWAIAWLGAWIVTSALVAAVRYTSGDPDSRLYAGISARLVTEPVVRWIAPEWWGFWGSYGPYCEHPVGMFVVPALLGRAGYPALQAAYAVNALYQILVFMIVASIGAAVIGKRDGRALAWLLQLLPIAFVFRVRANQEYAVLLGMLLALYAAERARTRPGWTAGMLAGFCVVLLVKGVFAFMVPLTCALWLAARGTVRHRAVEQKLDPPSLVEQDFNSAQSDRLEHHSSPTAIVRDPRAAWMAVLVMPLAAVLLAWAYESLYVHVTGQSFLAVYRARQMPEGALTAGSPAVRFGYNLVWYLARVIWFAFPWSLAAGVLAARAVRGGQWWPWPRQLRADNDGTAPAIQDVVAAMNAPFAVSAVREELIAARQGAWFGVVASAALVAAFSIAHRKADRYIFPVYFIVGATGAAHAIRRVPALGRLVDRLDRPWVPAALYVLLVLLRLVTRGRLPEFTFWRT